MSSYERLRYELGVKKILANLDEILEYPKHQECPRSLDKIPRVHRTIEEFIRLGCRVSQE